MIPETSLIKPGQYVGFSHEKLGRLSGLVVDVSDVPNDGKTAQVLVPVLAKPSENAHIEHWQKDTQKARHRARVESFFVPLAACTLV